MTDQSNPNAIWGPNQYAGFVAPSRPDASTVGPGGNTVDRSRIPRNSNTIDKSTPSPAHPLGTPDNYGA